MYHRKSIPLLVCLATAAWMPALTGAQESRSTRIQQAAKKVFNELDPSLIESELIESTTNAFQRSPITNPITRSQRIITDTTNNGLQLNNSTRPRVQPLQPSIGQTTNQIRGITNQGITSQGITNQGITSQGITSQGITNHGITNQRIPRQTSQPIQLTSPTNNQIGSGTTRQRIQQQTTSMPNNQIGNTNRTNRNTNKFQNASFPNRLDANMYETKSAPTIQTQIVAPRTINVNETARFFIQAQNIGNENVPKITLIATIPEHARFIGANPQPTNIDGQQYEFELTSLGSRSKEVIQIDVVPNEKLPLNIATQIHVESQQQMAVTVQQPVLQISVNGPEKIQTGQPFKHVVTVKNIGDGTAESVRLSTQRPHEIIPTNKNPKTLVPKLIPGQTARFELSSFAKAQGMSNMLFQVSARGAETRQANTSIRVIRPELGVQLFGPGQNYVGRKGIYTIQLQNTSELPIDDVNVALNVPKGLDIDTISQQAKFNNNGSMTWNFKKIGGNEQQVIQFRAKATRTGEQICQVSVNTKQTGSRDMSLSTQVLARADLSIRVTDSGEPIGIGSKSEFAIEVANHGSTIAEQVTVQVELPSALMPVNQTGYSIDPSGNMISFRNFTIEAGKRKTLKFKVVAVAEGEHIVRGSVSLEGSAQSISSENSIFVFESENAKVSEALVPDLKR